jgi:leader peptidase (prepilin peptidase)/N-methyltransferase
VTAHQSVAGSPFVLSGPAVDSVYVGAFLSLFFIVMLAIALIDARLRVIPNRLVYPAWLGFAALILAGELTGEPLSALGAVLGSLGYGGPLMVVAIASGGMGMGDVKLAALIGLVLGAVGLSYVATAAAAAFLAGGIGALVALLVLRRGRRQTIPFGPYLAAGAIAASLIGPHLAR